MRYIVEVPARFVVQVNAASHQQAKDFAQVEIGRVVGLMSTAAEQGSPEQCRSFETTISGLFRVTALAQPVAGVSERSPITRNYAKSSKGRAA